MLRPGSLTLWHVWSSLVIAVTAAIVLAPVAHADLEYNIIDIGTIRDIGTVGVGAYSFGLGIDSEGDVVGFSAEPTTIVDPDNPPPPVEHAFLYTYSTQTMTDLGALGTGVYSYAFGINDDGVVVGTSEISPGGAYHAFVYSDGELTDLGVPMDFADSCAYGINDAGEVVGYASMADGSDPRPFIYDGSTMSLIGDGDLSGYAYSVNCDGIAAGQFVDDDGDGDDGQMMDDDGDAINVGSLGGPGAAAYTVNDVGLAVGAADTLGGDSHAFVSNGTTMTDAGTLGGSESVLWDVNNSGVAVGRSYIADDNGFQAAIYNMTDGMQNLNGLIGDASANWTLWDARAINDNGLITGWGYYMDPTPDPVTGQYSDSLHAYLAVPVGYTPNSDETTLFGGPSLMSGFGGGSTMFEAAGGSPNSDAVGAFMNVGSFSNQSYDDSSGDTGGGATPELPPGVLGLIGLAPMSLIWLRRLRRK